MYENVVQKWHFKTIRNQQNGILNTNLKQMQ